MPIFVIHKHFASHLHWDLRLEMDGVLKSWAVPKEPNDKDKRLAIQVDDHDLGYASFEGTIPEGSYGAGKVIIWDSGDYELVKENEKETVVDFHGKKLNGKYVILRFPKGGEKSFLFFKAKE